MTNTRILRFALPVAVAAALIGSACTRKDATAGQPSAVTTQSTAPAALAVALGPTTISDVAERTIDSVVNISSSRKVRTQANPFFDDPIFRRFFGDPGQGGNGGSRDQMQQALGSGVIVTEDGIILTNNHVVEDSDKLTVTLHDNRAFEAEIVGTDPASDIAVIRLKGKVENLTPLPFGDSDALRLGEIVLAIGNPFGLSHTVTMGIVSAKGRANVGIVDYEDFIQTDAAINPGNSGGALINLQGELVGVNTAIASRSGGNQGVGFAIPVNMASSIMESLESTGKVDRGWLGVTIKDVSPEIAEAMNAKPGRGVLVDEVLEGPGKKAGMRAGDIILSVNGEETNTANRLRNAVAMLGSGKNASLRVLREGKEISLTVKLGERPDNPVQAMEQSAPERAFNGLSVSPLNALTRSRYSIPDGVVAGVVVTGIAEGPAANAGLREGDVILEINRKPADSVETFSREYGKSGKRVLLYVWRQGRRTFLTMPKP